MKQEFIKYLNELIAAAPSIQPSEGAQEYMDKLMEEKSEVTDNGKLILDYMQNSSNTSFKSKDIAEGIGVSSRGVSGSMRKLVTDGFVAKEGKDPVLYSLTEKGKKL